MDVENDGGVDSKGKEPHKIFITPLPYKSLGGSFTTQRRPHLKNIIWPLALITESKVAYFPLGMEVSKY